MTQHKRLLGFVIPLAVILTIIAFFGPALAAEFTADIVIIGPGDNYTFVLQVKDNMYRVQKIKGPMKVPPFPSIVNRDTGVTWGLNDQMHQYVEMKDMKKTIMMNPLVGWAMTRKKMTETSGPTETVNGYECETRIYTEAGKSKPYAKVWISKKLKHLIREERFGMNQNPVLELQNIQEGPVDSALFEIPAGYTKMDMGTGPASKPTRSSAKAESTEMQKVKTQTTPTPVPVPVPASSLAQAPGQSTSAAAASSGNLMFILDASGSMWGQVQGKAKIAIAKEVLTDLIGNLSDDAVVGLVAYGHRRKGDCKDVQELVPLSPIDKNKLIKTIQGLSPKGKTPISRSVRMTAERIKHLEDETTIILVSDGKETCDPDPCGLVKELKADGIKFVMHVIGFDVTEEEQEQLECMAKAGGGRYYTAGNAGEFLAAAREVVEAPTFTGGYLEITSLKEGRPFEARVDVYRHSDNKSMGSKNTWYHQKPAEFKLVPGIYYLKVTDRSVTPNLQQEIRDIEIVPGQAVEKTVSFVGGGVLKITAIRDGQPFEARADVYRQSDNKRMGDKNTWYHQKPAEFKLVPGIYYLKVTDRSVTPNLQQEIRDIEIVPGQAVEKTVSFVGGGVLKITAIRDGQPFEARADVYRQSDNKRMGDKNTWYHQKPAEFKLVPGVYYLKVFDRKTKEKKEIRDIEVVSGRTVEKTVVF